MLIFIRLNGEGQPIYFSSRWQAYSVRCDLVNSAHLIKATWWRQRVPGSAARWTVEHVPPRPNGKKDKELTETGTSWTVSGRVHLDLVLHDDPHFSGIMP